jgi:hypothetical protein
MPYRTRTAATLIASSCALAIAAAVAGRRSTRPRATVPGVDERMDGLVLDEVARSAITASLFASSPNEHISWTAMVTDPALHDTPSHIRLVGHYETELDAVEAAHHLADELNGCLLPGEAPLTATALGIEPDEAHHEGVGSPDAGIAGPAPLTLRPGR